MCILYPGRGRGVKSKKSIPTMALLQLEFPTFELNIERDNEVTVDGNSLVHSPVVVPWLLCLFWERSVRYRYS